MAKLSAQNQKLIYITAAATPIAAALFYANAANDLVASPTPANLSSAQSARVLFWAAAIAGAAGAAFVHSRS